ncbi:hypothetical protein ABPG72_022513 [Tetrahymena utriculariae]
MGQNGSTNCCGTTADCQQTEVEVSEYQLNQNQSLKRPAQIQSQNGIVLSEQQQKQLEEQHKILIQQQQQINQNQHLGSTQQLQTGNDKSSTKKKKNMQNQELANHLRKISNNDRIIMENSIIHSTTKRLNEVTSTKKIKKELSEIVHFAKVLQLKIISSSTLSKGSLLYINAQGLENSLRKELDGMTFFGCKKRCRNIDNINQGQFDNFSSYSSSSSNEDEMEEDDHTFDQAASNQILDDIYDDQDVNQHNNFQNKQQFQSQKNQSLFPKHNQQSQLQQKSGLNSKNNLKQSSTVSAQQKFNNLRGSQKQKNQKDADISFEEEEEKENNPLQMNKNGNLKQNGSLAKKSNQINNNNNNINKTAGDGFKKNFITKQQQSNQVKKEDLKDLKSVNKTANPQSNKINLNIQNENFKNNKNQFILEEKKNKVNKNGEVMNDFVIPSPDPEISKRHRGRHFQLQYDRTSNSYKIKDLGIGFGCFYKLDGPLLLKDNHLLNIGLIFVVINFTLNQDNTVLDASTINKSSNTTQQQHPSNNSQLKNNQSFLISQNISNNNKNAQSNQHQIQLQNNQLTSLNQSVDFVNESINKICIRLKFFGGPCNGESCILDPQKETFATIGRNKEQCTLHFDDHLLSKIQCRIVFKPNEGWYLIDGSQKRTSTNGTWLYLAEEKEIYEGMIFKANQTLFQCSLQ